MENSKTERQKVLEMLETGKITPADGVELLKALQGTETTKDDRLPRLSMIGAVLVIIGFFIPWAKVSPVYQLQRMFGRVEEPEVFFNDILPPGFGNLRIPISGADIIYGVGWQILLLGLAAALLFVWPSGLDSKVRRWTQSVLLVIGSFLLAMVFVNGWKVVNSGVFVVSAGFVFLWVELFGFRRASL